MRSSARSIELCSFEHAWSALLCVWITVGSAACGDDGLDKAQIERGRVAYAEYCALCHGDTGEGYAADAANALSNQEFLAIATDDFIRLGIERGRPGTPMSSWGASRGGPLGEGELDDLVALIRSWQQGESVDLSGVVVNAGEPDRGEAVYDVYCLECHGERGQGGTFMSVANPEFLAAASDAYLQHVVVGGRSGTSMIGYESELTNQNVRDVVALIRSWAEPVNDEPCELPSKDISGALLNPDGAPPAFADGTYVSVDDLFAAYDANSRMYLLDARPACDYVDEHIAGAASVPFFAVEEYFDQLPKDEWIVTYCACPHAEAGAAADALKAAGYDKVRVLDEGLPLWQERGYPLTSGPGP